jgi:hypothetical protein
MTERDAINALMRDRYQRSFCLPRFTPGGWWECDMFEITASGYFREYEVKLSRSDFLRDTHKEKEKLPRAYGEPRVLERKHEMLARGATHGPTAFWYVTPVGLLTIQEVPDYAGLIEMHDRGATHSAWRWSEKEVRKAPKLHREKIDPKVKDYARGICYYRMHDLLKEVRP